MPIKEKKVKKVKTKVKKVKKIANIEDNLTNIEDNTSNNELKINKPSNLNILNNEINTEFNFNNALTKAVNNPKFKVRKNSNNNKKAYNNYEDSFDDILSFRKKFTKREIDNIDVIVYHNENNDGMFSAAIAYHYLMENNSMNVILIGEKPGKFNFRDKIIGKNVLILDLSLRSEFLNEIIRLSKSCIVIDDHSKTVLDNESIFNGNNHSACGYTWKFFYPKISIPTTIIYIDNSDVKLFLSFIPISYSTVLTESIGIKYTHSKSKETMIRKQTGDFFIELWNVLSDEKKLKFLIAIGHYYHDFSENLKDQIAINAVPMNFQGYRVGVLNFNSPLLSKPVGRQIITNFKNRGMQIDFAVLWGYEYTSNSYRIQLMDDHKQTRIRMDEIAQKLGTIGGSSKGGGGHSHVGNFYWPKNNNRDIWDLFTKEYL